MKAYKRVLTIAGSDSGGGAGIQADLKSFSALGCYGMSVITALTAQNTVGVSGIHPVPPEFIARQIDAVMEDIGVDAVKIGMLHSAPVIEAVAGRLTHHSAPNIVLDPVMVAKSGDKLLQDEAIEALKTVLIPMVTIITPNLPEAAVLMGESVDTEPQMERAGRLLSDLGPEAVLVKGGHMQQENSLDILYLRAGDEFHRLAARRVETGNTHGTGCTLSSAIAAYLAQGYDLPEAVRRAKSYITQALEAGATYQLGRGHGPVHHFYNFWE